MRSATSELHAFPASYGTHALPIAFRLLWLHQLSVMPEDRCRRGSHSQCQLCCVSDLPKMVRAEAVPQGILRPSCAQPGPFPRVVNLSLQSEGTYAPDACVIRCKPLAQI